MKSAHYHRKAVAGILVVISAEKPKAWFARMYGKCHGKIQERLREGACNCAEERPSQTKKKKATQVAQGAPISRLPLLVEGLWVAKWPSRPYIFSESRRLRHPNAAPARGFELKSNTGGQQRGQGRAGGTTGSLHTRAHAEWPSTATGLAGMRHMHCHCYYEWCWCLDWVLLQLTTSAKPSAWISSGVSQVESPVTL